MIGGRSSTSSSGTERRLTRWCESPHRHKRSNSWLLSGDQEQPGAISFGPISLWPRPLCRRHKEGGAAAVALFCSMGARKIFVIVARAGFLGVGFHCNRTTLKKFFGWIYMRVNGMSLPVDFSCFTNAAIYVLWQVNFLCLTEVIFVLFLFFCYFLLKHQILAQRKTKQCSSLNSWF